MNFILKTDGRGTEAPCSTLSTSQRSGDCSHSVVVDAAPWGDDVRLSDIEPKFIYKAAALPVNLPGQNY